MTLPPVIRIFFALSLPDSIKAQLGHFISTLKKKSRSNAIRWTRPENLHITLQFLPEIQTEHLPALMAHVKAEIEGLVKALTITLGKVYLFPNPYRPRVIVLDVTLQEPIAILSGLIGRGIKAAHYEVESRPFRGHLTLGRIKQPQSIKLQFLSACAVPVVDNFTINEVTLYRSEPEQQGSKYTILEKIPLTA